MKITFVMTTANLSGGTRVIATHARQLMDRGHDVCVLTMPPPRIRLKQKISAFLRKQPVPKDFTGEPSFLDNTGIRRIELERFRPVTDADLPDADVVVATWWQTAPWVAALSPGKGAKAFFIQHYEIWGGDPNQVDEAWRLPLHKIVISRWLQDLATDRFGAGPADISLVPNSVDTSLFFAPPRGKQVRPTAGMLYNPVRFKGTDVCLAAVGLAHKSLPDLDLIAFGTRAPSADLPLLPGSRYIMNPPQASIREIYAQCDVWVCGSRSEGFHLPPLEAMACRCPVVSTRVGGPIDTIEDGVNGFLVDVEDTAALADRLARVLNLSDASWRTLSDAALATASRYSWQDAAALMERALQAAIAAGGNQPARR